MAVAVVVPVQNGAATIGEALQSVLDQTLAPAEVVVVDDGSTDDTGRIVAGFAPAVVMYVQAASGAGAARNAGVARTSSPWLAFLDADDRWVPEALSWLCAPVVRDPEVDIVLARQRVVPETQWRDALDGAVGLPADVRPGAGPGAVLIRRRVFEATGGFAPSWRVGEFIDWHLRACEQGARTVRIDAIVQWRRVHGANMGIVRRDAYGDYARIIKAALDRRRAGDA